VQDKDKDGNPFPRPNLKQWEAILRSDDPYPQLLSLGLLKDVDNPDDPSVCWPWAGNMSPDELPRVWVSDYSGSRVWNVRRLINSILQVVPTDGAIIHLSADNPRRVRPSHLCRTQRRTRRGTRNAGKGCSR
jgi:hypothetical protein